MQGPPPAGAPGRARRERENAPAHARRWGEGRRVHGKPQMRPPLGHEGRPAAAGALWRARAVQRGLQGAPPAAEGPRPRQGADAKASVAAAIPWEALRRAVGVRGQRGAAGGERALFCACRWAGPDRRAPPPSRPRRPRARAGGGFGCDCVDDLSRGVGRTRRRSGARRRGRAPARGSLSFTRPSLAQGFTIGAASAPRSMARARRPRGRAQRGESNHACASWRGGGGAARGRAAGRVVSMLARARQRGVTIRGEL
ncbi:MAG: hypothetical protein J3K34DRAFT_436578 [Monoraphidium minutum]|nr:MAG: hypothetical protein J3K34DRAFT_436578 [Monoraphidium minutum]